MAKVKTADSPKAKQKKASKPAKAVALRAAPKGERKQNSGKKSRSRDGVEALWKLVEHPLVGELLAIGATAAVAAIADGTASKGKKHASAKAAKAAGKAAAAAIGARLIAEFAEGKQPAKAKPAKA